MSFFIPRASNEYVRMDSFFSTVSQFSVGSKKLWSNSVISSLLVPTVGQAVHGGREAELFKAGRDPKTYQGKYHDIPEGRSTPIPNSPSIYALSI